MGPGRRTVFLVDYRLFARDLEAWLLGRGYQVEWLVPAALTVELFHKLCRVIRPLFVASINFSPELALLCSQAQTPYLSWTVDPLGPERFQLYPGTDPRWVLAFAHRRDTAERLRALGLADTEYLPLAASGRRQPATAAAELERFRAPLSFVGSSLEAEGDALGQGLRQLGLAAPAVAAFYDFVERALDEHEGDVGYAGVPADGAGLPDALASALPRSTPLPQLCDWVNGALSHRLRLRRVKALVPLGIVTYGDTGWQSSGARYAGVAGHGDELTCIYSASALSLDIPRVYQRDIVTMRVFDIMACGGVVLSEPSADLLELFSDGAELVTYSSDVELRQKAERLLASDSERLAIAEAGRACVARSHALEHRFERMLAGLKRRSLVAEE
jgi:spore maturation protein CgeB